MEQVVKFGRIMAANRGPVTRYPRTAMLLSFCQPGGFEDADGRRQPSFPIGYGRVCECWRQRVMSYLLTPASAPELVIFAASYESVRGAKDIG
jgi:hypothetical protein